jgi:hypothetical protein
VSVLGEGTSASWASGARDRVPLPDGLYSSGVNDSHVNPRCATIGEMILNVSLDKASIPLLLCVANITIILNPTIVINLAILTMIVNITMLLKTTIASVLHIASVLDIITSIPVQRARILTARGDPCPEGVGFEGGP